MKGGATKHAHGSQRREIGKENVVNTVMAVRGLNASALERIVCRNDGNGFAGALATFADQWVGTRGEDASAWKKRGKSRLSEQPAGY